MVLVIPFLHSMMKSQSKLSSLPGDMGSSFYEEQIIHSQLAPRRLVMPITIYAAWGGASFYADQHDHHLVLRSGAAASIAPGVGSRYALLAVENLVAQMLTRVPANHIIQRSDVTSCTLGYSVVGLLEDWRSSMSRQLGNGTAGLNGRRLHMPGF
jgi:hypothetical protein